MAALAGILGIGGFLRSVNLGRDSFWYDEVVTMRLARTSGPMGLVNQLGRIDATRAPLHPLILQGWIAITGPSEASARSLSVVLGLLLILVVFSIGRRLAGSAGGLWSALFCACSPLLIEYSRETRMYALLALLSCGAWDCLLGFRQGWNLRRDAVYVLLLVGLMYTHPLGLLMSATLGLAAIFDRASGHWTIRRWAMLHGLALLAILPWISRYLDHPPEFTSGRLPFRFLLGMPIGFLGGNSWLLLMFVGIISLGIIPWRIRGLTQSKHPRNLLPIAIWAVLPPVALYVYSWIGHPLFGPARYNLYAAPAFLILCAAGLARMRRILAIAFALMLPMLLVNLGLIAVIQHPPKAAWREAAEFLTTQAPNAPLVVISPSAGTNFEVPVARYYLGETRRIVLMDGEIVESLNSQTERVFVSVSLRDQRPVGPLPIGWMAESDSRHFHDFGGSLRLIELNGRHARAR